MKNNKIMNLGDLGLCIDDERRMKSFVVNEYYAIVNKGGEGDVRLCLWMRQFFGIKDEDFEQK